METTPAAAVRSMLAAAGIAVPATGLALVALSGGVSCDVWRVDAGGRPLCVVKRALPRLRVSAEWLAPVHRTGTEVRWLHEVRRLAPALVPEVIAEDRRRHMFAMRWLPPAGFPVWKDELFAGRIDVAFAAAVGSALARVHRETANRADIAAAFDTMADFEALRIDPFLRFTAARHPEAAARLLALADGLSCARSALVHGDVSPKNILAGAGGPVFLDAECAVCGDPAFDIAFCTSHLLLKMVHLRQWAAELRQAASALAEAWLSGADLAGRHSMSRRAGDLAAALLLARVDGKSPAPYLAEDERLHVRKAALALLGGEALPLPQLVAVWK